MKSVVLLLHGNISFGEFDINPIFGSVTNEASVTSKNTETIKTDLSMMSTFQYKNSTE